MKLRPLLLGRRSVMKLDSILKNRDITLLTKVHIVRVMVFPVAMYGCESWTIKEAGYQRIDCFWAVVLEKTLKSPLDSEGIFLFIMILPHLYTGEGNGTPLQYLAWKIPWIEELGGLKSMGSLRVGHDWATSISLFTFMHWRRKWQPTPVFLSEESQRRGRLLGCCLWGWTESDRTKVT